MNSSICKTIGLFATIFMSSQALAVSIESSVKDVLDQLSAENINVAFTLSPVGEYHKVWVQEFLKQGAPRQIRLQEEVIYDESLKISGQVLKICAARDVRAVILVSDTEIEPPEFRSSLAAKCNRGRLIVKAPVATVTASKSSVASANAPYPIAICQFAKSPMEAELVLNNARKFSEVVVEQAKIGLGLHNDHIRLKAFGMPSAYEDRCEKYYKL